MKRLTTLPNVLYSIDIIYVTSDLGENFILLAKAKRSSYVILIVYTAIIGI